MLRRNHIITALAFAACAVPASSAAADVPQPPDAQDAAQHRGLYEQPAPYVIHREYGSPDAEDAAKGRGVHGVDRAPYVIDRHYGSPDAADAARKLPPVQIATPTVQTGTSSRGFDWGDAGIGAAGMLALLSLAAGSALLVSNRRRRRSFEAVTR